MSKLAASCAASGAANTAAKAAQRMLVLAGFILFLSQNEKRRLQMQPPNHTITRTNTRSRSRCARRVGRVAVVRRTADRRGMRRAARLADAEVRRHRRARGQVRQDAERTLLPGSACAG